MKKKLSIREWKEDERPREKMVAKGGIAQARRGAKGGGAPEAD
jgi:hypothetical protein